MYTNNDYAVASANFKRRLAIVLIGALVGATATGLAIYFRIRWLAGILSVLTGCATYAYLSLKLMPHWRYLRFLTDMRSGLTRQTDGWFVSLSDETRTSDGVAVHEFIIRIGDQEEDERLFLWDHDKPRPQLQPDDRVHLLSFGKYIKELTLRQGD